MKPSIPLREVFLTEELPTIAKKPNEQSRLTRVDADRANRLAAAALATIEQFRKQLTDLQKSVGGKDPSLADAAARLLAQAKLMAQHEKRLQILLPVGPALKTDEDGAAASTQGMSPASSASSAGY